MKYLIYLLILNISLFACKIEYEEIDNPENIKYEDLGLGSSQCQATNEEIESFLDEHNITYDQTYDDKNFRFILSPCSPIVLVPGIYSTKLRVKINCQQLQRNERDMYEKVKLYCSKFVCTSEKDTDENRDLWFNLGKKGFSLFYNFIEPNLMNNTNQTINGTKEKITEEDLEGKEDWDLDNRHSACLGFFMTIFDNKDECPVISGSRGEKRICGHSQNIKISFEGGFSDDEDESDCGVKAVENVLSSNFVINAVAKKKANVFGDLASSLEDIGYTKGFSLGAIPNDFRKFIPTNTFAYESLKYQIEKMYNDTGKPVTIIAHSFGNLVTLNTLTKDNTLADKVKKWISIAPPFAGATKAIEYFLHGIKDFNNDFNIFKTEFKLFGQYMMLKSIPTVYELKPFNIFSELFENSKYKDFGNAIKERIKLEKLCKDKQCTTQEIAENSKIFNKYFINYFPNMDLEHCKYESSIGGNENALNKKCMADIFNIVDCPSIVKVKETSSSSDFKSTVYNIEDFCDKNKQMNEERYFPEKCITNSNNYKCLDELYPQIPNVFETKTDELKYFINRFNNLYSKEFSKKIDEKYFENSEEIKLTIKKMIEYQNEISIIKDLPIPPVDIDIIYSSYNPTLAAEFLETDTLNVIDGGEVNDGGDGTVPTWSSLLTALKWIYEKETENLPQEINIVQYCSRLANNDPKLTNFKAISCKCLDKTNNVYLDNLDECGHQNMLTDPDLFNYIYDGIKFDNINGLNQTIIKAIKQYKTDEDYLAECNHRLVILSSPKLKLQCENYEITEQEYNTKNFCSSQNYETKKGFDCCSVHVSGITDMGNSFNEYFCNHMKNNDDYKNFIKEIISADYELYNSYSKIKVEFDCISSFINITINLLIILALLSL